jgi:peptidoglycan/xylan/chitin deacetylase (PgdA/CDA1 family)
VGWDVVSGDPFQQDPAVIVHNVLDNVQPGSIVVMHLNGGPNAPATATALHDIIPGLQARGLQPVTLQELLAAG